MNVRLIYTAIDGSDAAARLASLLTTLGVTLAENSASDAVIALLTPAALHDRVLLQLLQLTPGQSKPPLPLSVPRPDHFPAPADLAGIIAWLSAPTPTAAPKYHIHIENATNSLIGDNGVMVNLFGSAGWSAAETERLIEALRTQPPATPMRAAELRGLLAQLQAQVQQVNTTLQAGFSTVLARFDLGEQCVVGPILARLDAQHMAEMAAILAVFDTAVISHDEMHQHLVVVHTAVLEAQQMARLQGRPLPANLAETVELAEAPGLDVKHKLKLTIPIIPLLLDYEGEFELSSKMNLENVWRALKRRITGR